MKHGWYRQPKTLIIEPFNDTTIHVPSRKKICVRQHHAEQQRLNCVNTTSFLALCALWPVYLNQAEKTSIIFFRFEESTFHIMPIDFENSPGKHVFCHVSSSKAPRLSSLITLRNWGEHPHPKG